MSNRKKLWMIVFAIAIIIGALGGYFIFSGGDGAIAARYKVEKRRIEKVISAQGLLEPLSYVDLGSQVSGQITKIHVNIGDLVKKKQLLLEIDPQTYAARVEQNKASIKKLEADLKSRRLNLELTADQFKREEELFKAGFSNQENFDAARVNHLRAETEIESLLAQIEQARSSLKQDEANLSYTKIYSPMDGTVVSLPVKVGQTINASMSTPNIMQVAKLDVMTVKAQVSEADIGSIRESMKIYFTTLGDSDKKWFGSVRQIEPTPTSSGNVVLYNVLSDVQNPDDILKISMSVQVYFIEDEADDALVVPISYIRREGKEEYVNVIESGGKVSKRTVKTGVRTRLEAQVTEGVKEGDELAVVSSSSGGGARSSSGSGSGNRQGQSGAARVGGGMMRF